MRSGSSQESFERKRGGALGGAWVGSRRGIWDPEWTREPGRALSKPESPAQFTWLQFIAIGQCPIASWPGVRSLFCPKMFNMSLEEWLGFPTRDRAPFLSRRFSRLGKDWGKGPGYCIPTSIYCSPLALLCSPTATIPEVNLVSSFHPLGVQAPDRLSY